MILHIRFQLQALNFLYWKDLGYWMSAFGMAGHRDGECGQAVKICKVFSIHGNISCCKKSPLKNVRAYREIGTWISWTVGSAAPAWVATRKKDKRTRKQSSTVALKEPKNRTLGIRSRSFASQFSLYTNWDCWCEVVSINLWNLETLHGQAG